MRKIAIFHLPKRGPRDEFLPLRGDPSMQALWVRPQDFHEAFPEGADYIVLPGSGGTLTDLEALRESGGEGIIRHHLTSGGTVVGICGGLQILGNMLYDPQRKQGSQEQAEGLGLLPIQTLFGPRMMSVETKGHCLLAPADDTVIGGQEHRSGFSWDDAGVERYLRLNTVEERIPMKPIPAASADVRKGILWAPGTERLDGFVSQDRRVWGTYIHLIFHNSAFCKALFQPV
jgi:adenosylcobyric acid synthase